MTTVILAEKPSQARSYVQAFQKSTKKQGYYTVSDPVLPAKSEKPVKWATSASTNLLIVASRLSIMLAFISPLAFLKPSS